MKKLSELFRVYGNSGQMSVELVCMMPVCMVLALIVYNLAMFMDAVAAFDQIAPDMVIAYGVSAQGSSADISESISEITSNISVSLGRSSYCDVSVSAGQISGSSSASTFLISPFQTCYTCTLTYHPWPGGFHLGIISFASPFSLTHTKELVVDRYRSGVVI